jgi:hypothetical protein
VSNQHRQAGMGDGKVECVVAPQPAVTEAQLVNGG